MGDKDDRARVLRQRLEQDYLWRKEGGAAQQTAALENELVGELSAARSAASRSSASHALTRQAKEEPKSDATPTNGDTPRTEPADSKSRRLNPIKRKQMQDRLHEIEEEISRTEAAIALCETQLQSFVSAEETQRQTQELAAHKSDLQGLMNEWEELSGELETTG